MSKSVKFWTVSILLMGLFVGIGYTAARFPGLDLREVPESPLLTMLAICFGTFVSEDLSTISSGLIAASGFLSYGQSVLAAFTGILIGDMIIFWMGHHFGRPMLDHRWTRMVISDKAVNRAQKLFHQSGFWIIITTRFLPGTRTATYFAAGAVHAPVLPFIGAFALAAALWTPLLVGLSYFIGKELLELYNLYEGLVLPALILAGLLLYLIFHYGLPLFTWKGRRRLKGKWIRAVKWEFWPVWQVYWLVAAYITIVGMFRYRNPLLFTAVNPCMPESGFIGESKSEILAGLSGAGEALPPWSIINEETIEERINSFDSSMKELNMEFPVVLKPDEGQRGAGVKVVYSRDQAIKWLEKFPVPAILQCYVGGNEYGVFYMRRPEENTGKVTSVTLKQQLHIVGNGSDTIDTLIHSHPRAIAMLDTFLNRFDEQLDRIPAEGECINLGELGTHARGSLFLDGNHLITSELQQRIQQIADSYPGFYFGRFDLKAPDDEAFMLGEGIQVMELNGVTSEETHIYDPSHGLFYAWKCLCRQWDLAFQIAAENTQRGHQPATFSWFLKSLFSAQKRQRKLD